MAKPTYYPLWATEDTTLPATGETNKVRPREVLRNIGWDKGQIPTCEEWNWTLNNLYNWTVYFDSLLGTPTDLATANTLALRDSTGSLHFYNLYVDNNLEVTGTGEFSGEVSAAGLSSSSGLQVTEGEAELVDATLSGTLSVTGEATFEGAITSSGGNTWEGANTFNGAINSGGNNTWTGTNTYSNTTTYNGSIVSTYANTFSGTNSFSNTTTFTGAISSTNNNTWTGVQTFSGANTHSGVETFSNTLNLKTSAKTTSGYTYLPNDMIIQWGYVALANMTQFNDYEGYSIVTLPIAFPNALLNASATVRTTQVSADSDCWGQIVGTGSKTQVTVQIQNAGETTFDYIDGVYWQAIGY